MRITHCNEVWIQQRVAPIVAEYFTIQVKHPSTGGLHDRLPRRRIPFRSRAEARIKIRNAFRHTAKLNRAAHRTQFVWP